MKLKVEAMHCAKCVVKIATAVNQTGVKAQVDLSTKTVQFADAAKAQEVVSAIESIGYTAKEV